MASLQNVILRKLRTMAGLAIGGTAAFGAIGVWTGNEKFFVNVLVPVLNRMDPELSHRVAVNVAKYHLTRSNDTEEFPNLETKIGGMRVGNPVGIAAGFDKNGECVSGLRRMGFGWVEIGSITPFPQSGNPQPRLFRLPDDSAVINRYGFNNDGFEATHTRLKNFKLKYPDYPVGVNLGANKESTDRVQDYCRGIEMFGAIADYFVINISSPNTPNLRNLQKSENLSDLVNRVLVTRDLQERKVPILIKVAPDLTDDEIQLIAKTLKSTKLKSRGIDGLIVSNTTLSRESLQSPEPVRSEIGGLSGKPLTSMSTELIRKFYCELNGSEVKIIGVGGISDGKDAFDKICAGASAVQIYTALTYQGPGLLLRLKSELSSLLLENGFESVDQAVGSGNKS